MSDSSDSVTAELPPRKPWSAPKIECVDVAERTNKKTVNPSDGMGAHTVS